MQQIDPAASATRLADTRNTLGEGATWCDKTHALYWVDIEGAQLWRCRADGSDLTQWPMPERLACFALTHDPDVLLVGLATQLAFFDLRSGAFTRIVDVEPDLPTRLNDGRCDPSGAFVFGMKDEGGDPPRAVGGFYRLNADLTLERLALPPAAIANSIAFSPDGSKMYFCDSLVREILVCDYGRAGVAGVRPFARLTDADGDPDGSTMDRDGGLWNAQWGGRRVVRYAADGVETERIAVPTAQPSCVTLDGEGRLYVTSARVGLSDDALASDADAGGVFVAQTRHAGLPTARFMGAPRG
ncbi:SMP-30/Gluconolaconase/LRE-like region family protein [Burkholderia ambifaria AMMD]|uniref:L-arabinonolactonase n=1 Tax=Burkholderia ambifaria (strain ATCC BAA-244 / DSM 16087 / CCUG 44356 / LMG 19182 / AMMD) TaxID=339670 RepID=Q0B5V6_BURCM|nr:SMP-30/gluconolactonase/LRE family protein [Burkholderia ambifaria]ABI90467.1 L-arabinonolactonase [Burkholderia ambifaria AMMD]AJY24057.1 SMP-30/Gluconolaconase/LRE-like region family protein [Burkholderia ambifaria AMMD]MBR7931756.1 SMP-30/gluconolactonase/LRE family protein [Burkholderia ambifaria]PEH68515.1 gluconolaconase [Burkholderia ambifaria]QQC06914.1 SMP-30/gluconolactonase/LRE family protein [Burkholderia ambifaria]